MLHLKLFLVLALAGPALAADPSAAPRQALTLSFVAIDGGTRTLADGQAWLDAGRLTARRVGHKAQVTLRQRVGVRLEGLHSSARLSIHLANDMPGCTLRVDGRLVSAIPQVIDPAHRVGATVVHDIELVIPAETAPGGFAGNLQWVAESN